MTRFIEKAFDTVLILLFCVLIIAPAVGHMSGRFGTDYMARTERRFPTPMPAFPETLEQVRGLPSKLTAWFDDHFGFRSWLVSLNSLFFLKMGVSASSKVIIGKNGWLFFDSENMLDQHRGILIFSEAERDRWIEAMRERKTWLSKKGVPFIIMVPPNPASIYPEQLPAWASKVTPQTRLDQLVSVMDRSGLDFIDLRTALLAEKKKHPVFYMTDSHWNFHGGFIGYREMMKHVNVYFPSVAALTPDDLELRYIESPGMDLCDMLNISDFKKDPHADQVVLKRPTAVVAEKKLGEAHLPKQVMSRVKSGLRVLIFCDSYTINLEALLNETFSEILYAGYDLMKFNPDVVEQFKPDLVLHIMVERCLIYGPVNPSIMSDGKLRIVRYGPTEVQKGRKFNIQPNGQSAFWIIGENISNDTVILWGDTRLDTHVDTGAQVLTALIPDHLYPDPGEYEIRLYDSKRDRFSDSVRFTVTD